MIAAQPVSFRFLEDLRAINPALKLVLITGYPEVIDFVRGSYSGVDTYLLKPFRRQQLLEVLRKLAYEIQQGGLQ
jgi:YesN/AraC family two-component response regulator